MLLPSPLNVNSVMIGTRICRKCGIDFTPDEDKGWQHTCFGCWAHSKGYDNFKYPERRQEFNRWKQHQSNQQHRYKL